MYYLGVDGGGTKTTAVLYDENLNEIARVIGDSINYYSEGMDNARNNMKKIADEIKNICNISDFDSVFIGMSALAGKASESELNTFCEGIFDCKKTQMNSDLYIALKATNDDSAVVVIAGTGSMVAGFDKNGEVVTAGGFGYILGDEGSGFSIAQSAMKAALRSVCGAEKETMLYTELLSYYSAKDTDDLIDKVYSSSFSRKTIAGFAKNVYECAKNGDAVANEILKSEAELLAKTTLPILEKTGSKRIYTYGGVFQNNEIFAKYFASCVGDAETNLLSHEPVYGAGVAAYNNSNF